MKKWLFIVTIGLFLIGSVVSAMAAVESTFHGQFRINYYSLSQDKGVMMDTDLDGVGDIDLPDGIAAARLRWRPTWDVKLSPDVTMHMQLNIGHIESNTGVARWNQDGPPEDTDGDGNLDTSGDPVVGLRHAMLLFTTPEVGGKIAAGLVPVSDKFGDTLFSSDWDFNPLTLAWLGKIGEADIRLAIAKLLESESDLDDDVDAYVADVDIPFRKGSIGGSVYVVRSGDAITALGDLGDLATQNYIGIRASQDLDFAKLNGFFLWNTGKIEACAICTTVEDVDNSGYAIKLEGTTQVGSANVGLMVVTASGDKDFTDTDSASSFITPMALIDHHGYWGYTGKLTVQGPTDTGIDNPLRIDGSTYGGFGLGYGIMTVQAKADFPVTDRLKGYAAVGIFQHQDVPSGLEKSIGTDFYLQGKYNIAENLNLDAGLDYASVDKNSPAYSLTDDNTITLLFARLQLEY